MKSAFSYIAALALVGAVEAANGQEIVGGQAAVSHVKMEKKAEMMVVSMDITPHQRWDVKSNREIVLTPLLEHTESNAQLPSIRIMGRNRYLHHLRNTPNGSAVSPTYKASDAQTVHYEASIPYQAWMEQADLMLSEELCGCCQTLLTSDKRMLSEKQEAPEAFRPVLAYIVPKAEAVKARSEASQAYVTFPVSQSRINESYQHNREELQKILNTMEKVRNDHDATITGMHLTGYASPEGSYSENERLAQSRTEAVADYVKRLMGTTGFSISTSSVAENWAGLEEYVRHSDLPEKEQLLAIIQSPDFADNPDGREWKMKSTYPDAYRRLVAECYPTLRKTDYRVEYTIRSFNIEEAKELIATQPQKLSLQEMYNVAQAYGPSSEEFNEVFATAVRMYPQDATANLNAANSALERGDLVTAEKYLQRAGDSGESVLARGVLAMLKGDATKATALMQQAESMGVKAASANLEQLQKKH